MISPATEMEDHQSPVAIRLGDSIEIINFTLKQHSLTTTIIVCASRSDFLADLQGKPQRTHSTHLPKSDENSDDYLSPTLHLLATSRKVQLAFTPTLPHLRAYLTAFNPPQNPVAASLQHHQPSSDMSMLVILSLVDLHRPTSEHSAQGISRTLAIAVEAARLAGMKLVLGEHYIEDDNDDINGINDGANGAFNRAQQDPWTEQIPILSGSVRFGDDERLRTGRTVDVGKVLGRWCRFMTLDTMLPRESEI